MVVILRIAFAPGAELVLVVVIVVVGEEDRGPHPLALGHGCLLLSRRSPLLHSFFPVAGNGLRRGDGEEKVGEQSASFWY